MYEILNTTIFQILLEILKIKDSTAFNTASNGEKFNNIIKKASSQIFESESNLSFLAIIYEMRKFLGKRKEIFCFGFLDKTDIHSPLLYIASTDGGNPDKFFQEVYQFYLINDIKEIKEVHFEDKNLTDNALKSFVDSMNSKLKYL
jgi:hypothetical protein